MATSSDIYAKLKIDTREFDGSLRGIKKEMATLKGLIGSNIISREDDLQLKARFGNIKDQFDDIRLSSQNIAEEDVFGNVARFAGVASQAVAGLTATMSLLGIESEKVGQVEKSILQFMAIGNALQALADSRRLKDLALIYAARLKDWMFTKSTAVADTSTGAGGGGGTGGTKILDTSAVANANAAANISQASSINNVSTAIVAQNEIITQNIVAQDGLTVSIMGLESQIKKENVSIIQTQIELKQLNLIITDAATTNEVLNNSLEREILLINRLDASMARKAQLTNTVNELKAEQIAVSNAEGATISKNTGLIAAQTAAQGTNATVTTAASTAYKGFVTWTNAASVSIMNFTKSLLLNPIFIFIGTLAAVGVAAWKLGKVLAGTADDLYKYSKGIKSASDANKEFQKSIEDMLGDMAGVNDKIAVITGGMSESQAKRNELHRKYWTEYKKDEEKLLSELRELERKRQSGEIESDTIFYALKNSLRKNFDNADEIRRRRLADEEALLLAEEKKTKEEKAKADAVKAKEDYNNRVKVEKEVLEKIIQLRRESQKTIRELESSTISTSTKTGRLIEERKLNAQLIEIEKEYIEKQGKLVTKKGTMEDYTSLIKVRKDYYNEVNNIITEQTVVELKKADDKKREDIKVLENTYIERKNIIKKNLEETESTIKKIKSSLETTTNKEEIVVLKKSLSESQSVKKELNTQLIKEQESFNTSSLNITEDFENKRIIINKDADIKIIENTTKFYDEILNLDDLRLSNAKNNTEILMRLREKETDPSTRKQYSEDIISSIQIQRQELIKLNKDETNRINLLPDSEEKVLKLTDANIKLKMSLMDLDQTIKSLNETPMPFSDWINKENWIDPIKGLMDNLGALTQQAADGIITIMNLNLESQRTMLDSYINDIEDSTDAALSNVEKLYKYNFITTEQYEKKKIQLEEQKNSKIKAAREEQFKKEQEAAVIMAVIQGALAIVQAYGQLGPIAGTIAALLIAGVTIAQISTIQSQPVPEYETGGLIEGPSHNQGGIKMNAPSGKVELEGGEYIINKNTVKQPGVKQLLEDINNDKINAVDANKIVDNISETNKITDNKSLTTSEINKVIDNKSLTTTNEMNNIADNKSLTTIETNKITDNKYLTTSEINNIIESVKNNKSLKVEETNKIVDSIKNNKSLTTIEISKVIDSVKNNDIINRNTTIQNNLLSSETNKILDKITILENGGYIKGPSHIEGGVKATTPDRIVELEGGEYIINKNTVKKPGIKTLLDKINRDYVSENSLRIINTIKNSEISNNRSIFENGGYIYEQGGVIENKKSEIVYYTNRFENGGLIPDDIYNNISKQQSTIINNYTTTMDVEELKGVIREVTSIPVTVLETDITRTQKRVAVIEQKSSW